MDKQNTPATSTRSSTDCYVASVDDGEPITVEWVHTVFPSMGQQYSSRRRDDAKFLVWLNRFERFNLHENPAPQLKTKGQVRMLVFALTGIMI